MTTLLSERQQLAKRLADELGKMDNVWVTSALPLPNDRRLRVQIADSVKNEITQMLRDWGWEPQFVSVLPRTHRGIFDVAACLYEIGLPREQVPVQDRTIHHDEIADADKAEIKQEIAAFRKAAGLDK